LVYIPASDQEQNCQFCDQLKIKFSKFAHKDTQNSTQNQEVSFYKLRNQFAASKAKQSKAKQQEQQELENCELGLNITHKHTHTPTSKTQHQNASAFVFGRKNPSLKLDHLSKLLLIWEKQIQSIPAAKIPTLSSSFFFFFWVFFFFLGYKKFPSEMQIL
jgi:hypothetical protein